MKRITAAIAATLASFGLSHGAAAQSFSDAPTDRVIFSAAGGYVYQPSTGLSGGGDFSASSYVARLGAFKAFENGSAVGLTFSYGATDYRFSNLATAPWGSVNTMRLSALYTFESDGGPRVVFVPSLRYDYEASANSSDGLTYGAILGASWDVSPTLSIGPGVGVFSKLTDGVNVFPALLIDWEFAKSWSLSTGSGLGASQGPGLNLDYEINEKFAVGISGRYENNRFRLDNVGVAPGGVGEDRSFPLVATVQFKPYPAGTISAFAGVEMGGQLTLRNAAGTAVQQRSYDAAPIFGLAAQFFF